MPSSQCPVTTPHESHDHWPVDATVEQTCPGLKRTINFPKELWVDPEYIETQRALGWPDIHPEDYCHKCGMANPLWYAEQHQWLDATEIWARETGREGICCPRCFSEMFNENLTGSWIMKITMERLSKE